MNSFVILFRQGPPGLSETDLARRQHEVSAWAREQNAAGRKLEPRILGSDSIRPATSSRDDGGGAPSWPVTALLFLEAPTLAEAAQVAESHPALRYGASVEVRPWSAPAAAKPPAPAR